MKVVFLDIDGVLNTIRERRRRGTASARPFDAEAIATLNELIEKADAKIVVSSMWRYYHEIAELDELLTLEGVKPGVVIDKTPDLSMSSEIKTDEDGSQALWYNTPPRRDEIADWLSTRPEVTHYVVLDDLADAGPINFVQTDEEDGFCARHLPAALAFLGVQVG